MLEEIIIGTEAKYAVNISASGFSMQDDDFSLFVSCSGNVVEYDKSRLVYDIEEEMWVVTIDTSVFRPGVMSIRTEAKVPDEDADDGTRLEVDVQDIAKLKTK